MNNEADIEDEVTKPLLEKKNGTSFLKLIIYGGIIVSPAITGGLSMSYSAIALPQMKLSVSDASWFGSVYNLGAPIGSVLIGFIIDKFGRRPSFFIAVIPSVIGWLLLCLDFNRIITFSGRILTGITTGCVYLSQVYSAECIVVNHPEWRNTLNTWTGVAASLGMLLDYTLGLLFSYKAVAVSGFILSFLLLFVIYFFIPESPRWLYHQGLLKEAKESERILGIHQPLLKHVDSVEIPFDTSNKAYYLKIIEKLKRKDIYKPLIVITAIYILMMFCGGPAVMTYLVDIISTNSETTESNDINGSHNSHEIFSGRSKVISNSDYQMGLIASILSLIAVFMLASTVHYIGIKKIFFLSSFGMIISLVGLSISLHNYGDDFQYYLDLIHVGSVCSIIFFYTFGILSAMTSILSEMFPHESKGFASIPAIIMFLAATVSLKIHPYLLISYGSYLYLIYACVNALSIIYVFFFIPETVGKSLEEVGEYFSK